MKTTITVQCDTLAKFAATYPDEQFVQQAVAQIPWSHNGSTISSFENIA